MTKTNIKLRGVELDAFRGFANPVKFDFLTGEGKLADLVVIFAPNGFGKTSFFEGVEWSVKGKIERIDENPTIRHAAEKIKGNILKNQTSPLTRGRVRLIDNDGTFFERTTSSSKNWDLLPGLVNRKSTSPILNGLATVNKNKQIEILPQSRIDSFLSSKTPQQKYEALLDFWGGKDDSSYYVGVSKLLDYTKADIAEVEETIKQLEREINEIAKAESRVNIFNSLVTGVNKSGLFEKQLNPFDENTTQQALKNTTSEILRMIADLEVRINETTTRQSSLSMLNTSADEYLENIKRVTELQIVLTRLKQIEADCKSLQALLDEQESLESKRTTLTISLSELELIATAQSDFSGIVRLLRSLEEERQNISRSIQDYATTKSKLISDLGQLDKQFKELTRDQEAAEKNKDVITDLQKRILTNSSKLPYANARMELAKNIKEILDQRIQSLSHEINGLQNISRQSLSVFVNTAVDDAVFQSRASEIITLFRANSDLRKQVADSEERLLKLGSLDENLEKLIAFGSLYVRDTETNVCPLCETPQNDFKSLLDLIERQRKDVLGVRQLSTDLSALKNTLKTDEERVTGLFSEFVGELNVQIQLIMEELRKVEKKSAAFAGYIKLYENMGSLANSENNRFSAEVTRLLAENEKLLQATLNSEAQKNLLNGEIQKLHQLQTANKVDTDSAKAKLSELEAKIKAESNQGFYIKVLNYLKINNITETEFLKNGLTTRKTSLERSQRDLETKRNDNKVLIEALEKKNLPSDIKALTQEIGTVEQNLKDVSAKVESFINQYFKVLASREVSKKDIRNVLTELNRLLKTLNSNLLQLKELQVNLEYMRSSLFLNTKRAALASSQKQLDSLKASELELAVLKEKVSKYLSDKINSVFNQQTINDIYQKIDPHPDLKQIRLEPKFDEAKPTLNILAVNEEGDKPIDPALYLSSAQVNILSLSIFLAKALQNNDVLINTIFMDDPIQYLDSINVLSFIDLMRIIITDKTIDRQLVISTHDENFFKLLQRKFDPEYYPAKFIQFESYGKLS